MTLKSSYFGRKLGQYSVEQKYIAKQDIPNLLDYKEDDYHEDKHYLLCSSLISQEDVIQKAYQFYQVYMKDNNILENSIWTEVTENPNICRF